MTTNILQKYPAFHDIFAGLVPMTAAVLPLPSDAPTDCERFAHEDVQLAYSPTTGKCFRYALHPSNPSPEYAKWNLIQPGTSQGTYTVIKIKGSMHQLHRIVAQHFLNGGKPLSGSDHIDHVLHADGSHGQDVLNNLRITDHRGNGANRRDGSSKFTGVTWYSASNKWCSQIRINKQLKYLGLFKSEYEAALAYIHAGENQGYDMAIARERYHSITGC